MKEQQQFLNDFSSILERQFDLAPVNEQPLYLVEIGTTDASLLIWAYEFISTSTLRGRQLHQKPLEVISLLERHQNLAQVRSKLAEIPHKIASIQDLTAHSVQEALKNAGIHTVDDCLFLTNSIAFAAKHGVIAHLADYTSTTLLEYAGKSLFPTEGLFFVYKESHTLLMHMAQRTYRIRNAETKDLSILSELDILCWPPKLAMSEAVLKKRIETYPQGQLVLEDATGVKGVVYSQRIDSLDPLFTHTADSVSELHTPSGRYIQLLALNIHPNQQKGSFGGQLLEFCLQNATLTDGVDYVAGVTRCVQYPGSTTISMQEYLKQEPLDPVPRMHTLHGATIQAVVPQYRPLDSANEGFGVLVVYDLAKRKPKTLQHKDELAEDVLSEQSIAVFVDNEIIKLLAEEEKGRYARATPLMSLGLDSLQLMELRSLLGWHYSLELPPTFFFDYGTAQEAIDFLVAKKLQLYKDWLYEIALQPKPLTVNRTFTPDRLWLVFGDKNCPFAANVIRKLEENSQYVTKVEPDCRDLAAILSQLPHKSQLAGVIYAWGWQGISENPSYQQIESYINNTTAKLVDIVNQLVTSTLPESSKLWIVTKDSLKTGSETSLVQSTLLGLSKVIREEYPKSQCSLITVDETCIDQICQELLHASDEPQIVYQDGLRYVARMVPTTIKHVRAVHFESNATYLIAGGLRPLGLRLARWYIEHGAKWLVLLDDFERTDKTEQELESLRQLGAHIEAYSINFEDLTLLTLLFDSIQAKMPPLKGVIHSAGVIDNDLLLHMDWERFKRTHRLKIAGSWHLHLLTKDLDLDHFVLFSTVLADLAPLGKASGVTGNSFLDALAEYRRKRNLPAITIDWAPWETKFTVIRHLIDNSLTSRMKLVQIEDGLKILEELFYCDKPRLMAVEVEWSMLLRRLIRENPLFEEMTKKFELDTPKHTLEHEPIAIIGIGCRFPGGATTPEKYWQIFAQGIDAIKEVPEDRWDIDAYFDADKAAPGKMYTRYGGFIEGVDLFDPEFFGISPREAKDMDPQQRIALEVSWEALENAGINPASLKGTNTGVFMGICFNDYGHLITQSNDPSNVDDYFSTGNHYSVTAGRICYFLGLEGPSMAIDTACSSSLVSIDNAVKHLQNHECDMAIAGGVNLILAPETTINFCKSGMLADDGRCKTFDASANGYVRSEGCGIVILKRLSDALRDKDTIQAVIRATAINQDGASTGLTVPNGQAQRKLIESALEKANLSASDIDYVEAHGTGTSLGDPIEVKALVETYGQNRKNPLYIGSAKTNIGHLEASAGVAGLIKCVLALQHGKIPKHLHFHKLNPYISLNENDVKIPLEAVEWQPDSKARIASVSSFGFSGTNAHAIIEEPPKSKYSEQESGQDLLLTLSAKSENALKALVDGYKEFLPLCSDSLEDITYSANRGRAQFSYRTCLSAKTKEELLEKLCRGEFTVASPLKELASRWLQGETIDWAEYYKNQAHKIVLLPNYPFQRTRYWLDDARPSQEHVGGMLHPLVMQKTVKPNGEIHFETALSFSLCRYLKDHVIFSDVIFPATGYIEMFLAAARFSLGEGIIELANVSVEAPLALAKGKSIAAQLLLIPSAKGFEATLYTQEAGKWTVHAKAFLALRLASNQPTIDKKAIIERCKIAKLPKQFYEFVKTTGIDYGKDFQVVQAVNVGTQEAFATLQTALETGRYLAHPALLDGVMQLVAATLSSNELYLPIGVDAVELYEPLPNRVFAHWRELQEHDGTKTGEAYVTDTKGKVLAKLTGLHFRKASEKALKQLIRAQSSYDDFLYEWIWKEADLKEIPLEGKWLLVAKEHISLPLACDTTDNIGAIDPSYRGVIVVASGQTAEEILKPVVELTKTALLTCQVPFIVLTKNTLAASVVDGFHKTALLEHPELTFKHIKVSEEYNAQLVVRAIVSNDRESIYFIDKGKAYVPRLVRQQQALKLHHTLIRPLHQEFRLKTKQKGLLENLELVPLEETLGIGQDEVEVAVRAVGLNFRDVLDSLGLYPGDPGPLGCDGAGIVVRVGSNVSRFKVGDPVVGMMMGCLASKVLVHHDNLAIIPEGMSFEEAATIPTVFLTVFYAFTRCAKIKQGDTVLIHAGAGGVGQAAIQLAKHFKANIITTAGSEPKKEYLRAQGIEHVFDSRSTSFAEDIARVCGGNGVDIVLNSLSGPGFIDASLLSTKNGGTFLEIGKRDILSTDEMQKRRPDISYHVIALDDIALHHPERNKEMLDALIPLFVKKQLTALAATKFTIEESIQAFEFMQAAKHIGKVVLCIDQKPRMRGTALITGGAGGLGLVVANWLSQKGVKKIILTGRKKLSEETKKRLELLACEVEYEELDVSSEQAVKELFLRHEINSVFHLAGIIEDAILEEQSWSSFERVLAPKVAGSYFLHTYSHDLDNFVLFSSIASSLGNPGQSNYAAANSYMDMLASMRHKRGLPALSISWGPWREVGMAKDLHARHAKGGLVALTSKDGIALLERALTSTSPHITACDINWKVYTKELLQVPSWYDAFYEKSQKESNLAEQIASISGSERKELVEDFVVDTVKTVLGISKNQELDVKKGFFDMGLDSLMAVELKNRLQQGVGKKYTVSTTCVFDYPTIDKMSGYLAKLLEIEQIVSKAAPTQPLPATTDEPIAIIGLGCRFPGGANSPAEYWNLLHTAQDAISKVPESRWNADAYYDEDPKAAGKIVTTQGGFLSSDVALFDADFFRMSPKEAEFLDPQQRLLLEVTVEALECSGIAPETLEESQTAVFIGMCSRDYVDLLTATGDKELISPYMATGNMFSTASGRISYVLGLHGPSMTIDTACSSSLVCINQAADALRRGSADLALAGGVNLILSPDLSIDFSKAGMLSPDGRCKTFDASANGYVRGEGCGIVVLKRLSDAKRDKNHILAVIRSSNVNQDGAKSGLTVPNGQSQKALLEQVLTKACLEAKDIDYVEAHGTGTQLGDPIEFRALSEVYGDRPQDKPLRIGSVKTNIGHLEGAAGVAGVIKVVLSLLHEEIPAHLHFKTLNPHIVRSFPVEIPTKSIPWKRTDSPRRAAVSSFGFSGTNSHLIIEEHDALSPEIERNLAHVHPFTRKRFWAEAISGHPLLGKKHLRENGSCDYTNDISLNRYNYLADHRVFGHAIYPAAGYIEMLLSSQAAPCMLRSVSIEAVLEIPEDRVVTTQVIQTGKEVEIYSKEPSGDWTCHAKALVEPLEAGEESYTMAELQKRCHLEVDVDEFYKQIKETGIEYGPAFQTIEHLYRGEKMLFARVQLGSSHEGYFAHPALLDGCIQLAAEKGQPFLPIGCDKVMYYGPLGKQVYAFWEETAATELSKSGNLSIFSVDGSLLLRFVNLHFRKASAHAIQQILDHGKKIDDWLYHTEFDLYSLGKVNRAEPMGSWRLLTDMDELASTLTQRGLVNDPTSRRAIHAYKNGDLQGLLSLLQTTSLEQLIVVAPAGVTDGFMRTLFLERPKSAARYIRLGSSWDMNLLVDALCEQNPEEFVEIQQNTLYVPRLRRLQQSVLPERRPIDPHASYLVTGGFGGIGAVLAKWLLSHGATDVVLTGRTLPQHPEVVDPRVRYISLDAADEKQVAAFISESKRPIKGVFHLAGVLDDATIEEQTWERFLKVFRPKVMGSDIVNRYFQDVDYFVLFSSVASTLGNPGQSNYSAANAFMDLLAHERKQKGLQALSISWGPWSSVGMAVDQVDRLKRIGLVAMDPIDAVKAFEYALATDLPHVTIANIDWKKYQEQIINPVHLIESFIRPKEVRTTLVQELERYAPELQEAVVKQYVAIKLRQVLGMATADIIDEKRPFFELGLDSLMAVDLKNRLQADLGATIAMTTTTVFDESTVEKMGSYLFRYLAKDVHETKKLVYPKDLYADATLSPTLKLPVKRAKSDVHAIFITGATGGLGAHLLEKVAKKYPAAQLYCLVRAETDANGLQRIKDALEARKISYGNFIARIKPVLGDLQKPQLGIDEKLYEELAASIDLIFHAGALVNWSYSYDMLKPANVGGTKELINFACQTVLKPVAHVSTMAIYPMFKDGVYNVIDEDADIMHKGPLLIPYYQTKWVAEMQMQHARQLGVPVNIFRPGSLICDLENGIAVPEELTYRFIDGCRKIQCAPDVSFNLSLTPLDSAAAIIAYTPIENKNYNIVNPDRVELHDILTQSGSLIERVPLEVWIQRVRADEKNPVLPLLDIILEFMQNEETTKLSTNTLKAIEGTGIRYPIPREEIIRAYLKGL